MNWSERQEQLGAGGELLKLVYVVASTLRRKLLRKACYLLLCLLTVGIFEVRPWSVQLIFTCSVFPSHLCVS